jgi:hypothetical protein
MKVWALTIFLVLTGCIFQEEDYIPVEEEVVPTPTPSPSPSPSPKPSPKPPNKPVEPSEPDLGLSTRDNVIKVANGLLGLRETNGKNRSPIIDQMNKFVGAPLGSPWCASFNAWIYKEAGVKNFPKSAWSPDWVKNPSWTRATGGKIPLPGDAFGIWFSSKNRVAHTGLVEKWGNSVTTVEGNTGPSGTVPGSAGDREGDGSYKKFRLKSQIYSTKDWIKE